MPGKRGLEDVPKCFRARLNPSTTENPICNQNTNGQQKFKMREHKDSVIKHCLQQLSCVSNSYSDSPSNNWTCLQRPIDDKKNCQGS